MHGRAGRNERNFLSRDHGVLVLSRRRSGPTEHAAYLRQHRPTARACPHRRSLQCQTRRHLRRVLQSTRLALARRNRWYPRTRRNCAPLSCAHRNVCWQQQPDTFRPPASRRTQCRRHGCRRMSKTRPLVRGSLERQILLGPLRRIGPSHR